MTIYYMLILFGYTCSYVDWCIVDFFFFFKQKTAYEMRISDWSSDVCSSDLKKFQFDPWNRGLVLLTLVLSLQAAYAAPLILLAQNRQEQIGRASCRERVCQYV